MYLYGFFSSKNVLVHNFGVGRYGNHIDHVVTAITVTGQQKKLSCPIKAKASTLY
jgi:hypothetical protein